MAGEKPLLRVAIYPMGNVVSIGDSRTIGGWFGPFFMDYVSYYNEFNRTFVWVMDQTLTGSRINDRYTGVMKQFQANESDACLIPNERSPEVQVVEFGQVITASPVLMISSVDIQQYSDQILQQLFRFSVDIVFLLLVMMYAFAQVLSRSEGGRFSVQGLTRGLWQILKILLNQVQVTPVTVAGRILVLLTVIGVFFWLQIWQNQMKMEMVAYDTSSVVNTLDEALHANKTLVMTRTESATMAVEEKAKYNPESALGKLCRKARFNNQASGSSLRSSKALRSLTREEANKHVVIVSQRLLSYLEASICATLKTVDPKFDFLIGDEIIVDIFTGTWLNPLLNPVHKEILRKKSSKVREQGLGVNFGNMMEREIRTLAQMLFVDQDIDCVYPSLEEFMSRKLYYTLEPLTLTTFWDIMRLLLSCSLAAFCLLVLERSGLIKAGARRYRSVAPKVDVKVQTGRRTWPVTRSQIRDRLSRSLRKKHSTVGP